MYSPDQSAPSSQPDLPRSVTPARQVGVLAAALVCGAGLLFWIRPTDDPAVAALLLLAILAVSGALGELLLVRGWRNPSFGLDFRRVDPCLPRVLRKLAGLWAIFVVIGFAYWALPTYRADLFAPFRQVVPLVLPWLVGLSVPYIALVDAVQTAPEDALWRIGGIVTGRRGIDRRGLGNYLLGWLVKAFFLPLMFCFLTGYIRSLWAFQFEDEWIVSRAYELLFQTTYFVDVAIGSLGYCMTLRLLGTHIRSVEPTVGGWAIAVICYPPFWDSLSGAYFVYDPDWQWGAWLWDRPILYSLWAAMILCAVGVYAWATIAFGLRFSNLTHRGIITNGPYRYTKHPAYIAKNLSWWLVAIPFVPQDGTLGTALSCSVMLLGVNTIYYLRAKTEERHLMADPDYRAYAAWIDRNGLFRRRW